MDLNNDKLVALQQLATYNTLIQAFVNNQIWVGTTAEYDAQKSSITSPYVILTDDQVAYTDIESASISQDDVSDLFFET